ncbi:MAG: hypothetical protein CSB44_06085, partial [Gammaproteobacteria bacterium]
MNLYMREETTGELEKIDWYSWLRAADTATRSVPVVLMHKDRERGENRCVQGFLHAIPLLPTQASKARQRAAERARKRGSTASRATRFLAGWVLLFSSLPSEMLTSRTIASLYRVRWQV